MKKAEPIRTTVFLLFNRSECKPSSTIFGPKKRHEEKWGTMDDILNMPYESPPSSTIVGPKKQYEEKWGTMDDILNIPYEGPEEDEEKAKRNFKDILDLPPLSDEDYEEDSGDENHMKNFVSLSDDENTVEEKQARAEYNFRKRVDNKKKARVKSPIKNTVNYRIGALKNNLRQILLKGFKPYTFKK
jgi:hypothetical protein